MEVLMVFMWNLRDARGDLVPGVRTTDFNWIIIEETVDQNTSRNSALVVSLI